MSAAGIVSLLTDFGPGSVYVGQLHATILRHAGSHPIRIVDVAHDCPFAGIESAGYILRRSYRHFPAGTVHMAVVDPGVGGGRAILCGRWKDHIFLAPDNGLLTHLTSAEDDGVAHDIELRVVENRALMNERISNTFHGRDIFAPVATHLACGGSFEEVGPAAESVVSAVTGPIRNGDAILGRVLVEDRFGNLITNIHKSAVLDLGEPENIRVRVGSAFINQIADTFCDVDAGVAMVYFGSGDHLEVAVNGGRAADALHLSVGSDIHVERLRS